MNIKRVIVGITGASGAAYGVEILKQLHALGAVETHLILTKAGGLTLAQETNLSPKDLQKLVTQTHAVGDVGACIASGSFANTAMIVAPCSMHSLAEIAHGISGNLLTRAADVMLKERRPLTLMVRETPLHAIHLENMQKLATIGANIMPPVPALYLQPKSLDEMIQHTASRALATLGIHTGKAPEWPGLSESKKS